MKFVGLFSFLAIHSSNAFTFPSNVNCARKLSWSRYGTLDGKTIEGEFTPVNDRVLIKLDSKAQETEGGLILTSKVKVKSNEGVVVSTGPGKINQETGFEFDMPVSAGEKVVYGNYVGMQVNYNGDEHVLIQDSDILVKYLGEKLNLDTAEMLRDNVLVKIEKKDEAESAGGILLAKTSAGKPKPTIGEVVKVGPGRYAMNGKLMEMDVESGDMIRFRDFSGNKVEIDGEEYSVVRMNEILAKF